MLKSKFFIENIYFQAVMQYFMGWISIDKLEQL